MPFVHRLLLGCTAWWVCAMSLAAAPSSTPLGAAIAPQPLDQALAAFGEQTGLQIFYVTAITNARNSKGARTGLAPAEALSALLDGTGLRFEFVNARAVRIFAEPRVPSTVPRSGTATSERHSSARGFGLEEVVVTGTRGQEPLSRVPIDMAVWTEEAMEASHVKGMAQLAALTPGVAYGYSPAVADAYTSLAIRGVTNRHGTAVGVYLDDSPIPPSRAATYLLTYPATFDLDRVEILPGPQTVLLGDHAMGGAVRFIVNQPSLTTSTGLVRAEWGATEYGTPSYEAGAAVGGPLVSDVLGFRVSGWLREDGGYVDRVDALTGAMLDADSNRHLNKVVRGALTFAPAPTVQFTPSLIYQSIRIHDQSALTTTLSDPGRGVFREASLLQQPSDDTYYLASLKLVARLRAADLSAVTSYFDQTATLKVSTLTPYADPEATDWILHELQQRAYRAEVRLASLDPEAWLTWVAGTLASNEHGRHAYWTSNLGSDATVTEQSQLAGFGQAAVKVTKRLTADAGVRIGHSKFHFVTESPPVFNAHHSDTWTAPRFGLSCQADEHNLVYLTVAKGYGSGGVYPRLPWSPLTAPVPYPPDTLWSYEIGSKHDLSNGRLRLEASVFHVDWDNGSPDFMLLNWEQDPVPGRAVSNGFGVSALALVGEHAKVALDLAYTDAHFTQTLTRDGQLFVSNGDGVPVSPWNVTASAERDFPLRGNVTATVRVEDAFRTAPSSTYQDNPASVLYNPTPADRSTNVLNLRAAVKWSSFEVAAFLSNALGSQPTLRGKGGAVTNAGPDSVMTLAPRTLSVSGTWRF